MNVENVGEEMAAEDMILRLHKARSKSGEQPTTSNIFDKFLRQQRKNQFSLLNSLWFAVGSLMQQGPYFKMN